MRSVELRISIWSLETIDPPDRIDPDKREIIGSYLLKTGDTELFISVECDEQVTLLNVYDQRRKFVQDQAFLSKEGNNNGGA